MEREREKLQEQCRRFSCYLALLREDNGDPWQRALQSLQNMLLVWFLAAIQKDALDLLQAPEEAEEIGADILKLLDQFSEEYANLLEQEYERYSGKNNPPG